MKAQKRATPALEEHQYVGDDVDVPDTLSCCVCLELFHLPILLLCHHSVCRQCAIRITTNNLLAVASLRCPMCRCCTPARDIIFNSDLQTRVNEFRTTHGLQLIRTENVYDVTAHWRTKPNAFNRLLGVCSLKHGFLFFLMCCVVYGLWPKFIGHYSDYFDGWLVQLFLDGFSIVYYFLYGTLILFSVSITIMFFGTLYFVFSYFINLGINFVHSVKDSLLNCIRRVIGRVYG